MITWQKEDRDGKGEGVVSEGKGEGQGKMQQEEVVGSIARLLYPALYFTILR